MQWTHFITFLPKKKLKHILFKEERHSSRCCGYNDQKVNSLRTVSLTFSLVKESSKQKLFPVVKSVCAV